jgi:hypothetical protein
MSGSLHQKKFFWKDGGRAASVPGHNPSAAAPV